MRRKLIPSAIVVSIGVRVPGPLTYSYAGIFFVFCFCFVLQESIRKHQSEGTLEGLLHSLDEYFPFDGLETKYFQHKYYKENFNLLVRCYF